MANLVRPRPMLLSCHNDSYIHTVGYPFDSYIKMVTVILTARVVSTFVSMLPFYDKNLQNSL